MTPDAPALPETTPTTPAVDEPAGRPWGLGSSDAGTIAGRNPWKSPYRLWMELLRLVDITDEEKEHLWWGKKMQPLIIERYRIKSGRQTRAQARRQHRRIPYVYAEPDSITLNMPRGPGVVEAKNTNQWSGRDWKLQGLPDMYFLQIEQQIDVFDYEWGTFAVGIGGSDFFWYDVERDQKTIELQNQVQALFWHAVQTGEPPPLKGTSPEEYRDLLHTAYAHDDGTTLTLEPDSVPAFLKLLEGLTQWKAKEKEAQDLMEEYKARRLDLENRIKATMQTASELIVPSYGKVTWREARPTPQIDVDFDKLRGRYPDVFKDVCSATLKSNGRRFYLKPDKPKGA